MYFESPPDINYMIIKVELPSSNLKAMDDIGVVMTPFGDIVAINLDFWWSIDTYLGFRDRPLTMGAGVLKFWA